MFKKVGTLVVSDAQSLVPRKSGALAASIKSSNAKNKTIVRAGSSRLPYAGVIHYGGYNNIDANPFLTDAVQRNGPAAKQIMDDGLEDLIRQYGLR
ncbi:hypothetical protein [Nocardioides sp. Leaf307]|uniref:hypothetical protein n=1 Tax=Nocardioides sp. Leaf307 TaxID=1736331 RepID=UPI0012EA779B|nr:hypothetical protein [Nocardioides sp. Leaf307]